MDANERESVFQLQPVMSEINSLRKGRPAPELSFSHELQHFYYRFR